MATAADPTGYVQAVPLLLQPRAPVAERCLAWRSARIGDSVRLQLAERPEQLAGAVDGRRQEAGGAGVGVLGEFRDHRRSERQEPSEMGRVSDKGRSSDGFC